MTYRFCFISLHY